MYKRQVKRIADISDSRIRDNEVRTALPILLFRDETIDDLIEATTTKSLRDIVAVSYTHL